MEYELGFTGVLDPLDSLLADPVKKDLFDLASPLIFLGGPPAAMALNIYAVLGVKLARIDGAIAGTVSVRTSAWNLAVVATSGALMMALFAYPVVENLGRL